MSSDARESAVRNWRLAPITTALRRISGFWELPFLAALAGFMFWVRMLPYASLVGGERAYYIGTDPFYHFRETLGAVRSFPRVPRFDPFTFYPHGTTTGQFGSLFDWAAAAAVVATSGRDASEQYIGQVLGFFPAVLGALLVVPFYFLAKRMLGTPGAIVASLTLAVLPGEFLIRSIAGYADHHVAEMLMAVTGILGVYVAAHRSHEGRAGIARWRNVRGYRGPLAWSVVGGIALAANFYAWPPAILFLAILTLWLMTLILLENAKGRGESARGYVFAGVVAFTTTGLLMIPVIETTFIGEFNTYGILHPLACFAAALGLIVVHAASRITRDRRLSVWIVPAGLATLAVAAFFALRSISPATYGSFRWGLSWVTGFGVPRTTLTISEARAADYFCTRDSGTASCLATDFGLVAPVTAIILIGLFAWTLWKRRPSDILLLIWSIFMFRATDTQIRFSYYLAINMALLIGWLAARLVEGANAFGDAGATTATPRGTKGRKTQRRETTSRAASPMRASVAALAILLVLPGNVFGIELAAADADRGLGPSRAEPGWKTAGSIKTPDSDLVMWMDALDWVRVNTPESGVDLGRVIARPPSGEPYQQAAESYGILSWWDYGHWMEVVARRAPVANPFQQAAPFASCYFTETDPDRAEAMLAQWSQRTYDRRELDCEAVPLPARADVPASDENPVRYVMIDDAMAAGKFGAITVWAGCEKCLPFNHVGDQKFNTRVAYYDALFQYWREYTKPDGTKERLPWNGEPYDDSMLSRLYFKDGNTLENYRLVHETPYGVRIGWLAGFGTDGMFSHNQNDFLSDRRVWQPHEWASTADGMFPTSDNRFIYEARVVASVKTYEHVKGANLTGTGAPPGSFVALQIPLVSDTTKREFSYEAFTTAGADGSFFFTVPYATTAYIPAGEGGTNTIILARGPAVVYAGPGPGQATHQANIDIPDAAVLQGQAVGVALAALAEA